MRAGKIIAIGMLFALTACGTRVTGGAGVAGSQAASAPGGAATATGVADPAATDGPALSAELDGPGPDQAPTGAGAAGGAATEQGSTADGPDAQGSGAPDVAAGSTGPASGEPIIVGAVGTRSGLIGDAVANAWRGLSVWERSVNARGGIQGRPVRVITADDAGDPGRHAAAVRQLILEHRVQAFVGSVAPITFSAGVPILEQHGIPALGGDSSDAGWFRSPMAFPIGGGTLSRAVPIAKWATQNLPQRRAAVFYVNEADAPRRLAEAFRGSWEAGGGQTVVFSGVSLAQPDFTSQVLQAKGANADVTYLVLEHAACRRFFDAARRQQFRPVFLTTACTLANAMDYRDLLDGNMYTPATFRPVGSSGSPAEQEILDAIARFDPDLRPDGAFLFTWMSGKLFEAAGGTTTEEILEGLLGLRDETLGGMTAPQTWPPGPRSENSCGMVSRFEGDSFNLLHQDFIC